MKLACVGCGADLAANATFCNQCGRPVDADHDGVPDGLGRLIEAKAREIVADERRKEQAEKDRQLELAELQAMTVREAAIEVNLRDNVATPRAAIPLFLHILRWWAVAIFALWIPFGFAPHAILSLVGYSPAGVVLCPLQCPECSGPGRSFMSNYKGSWHSEKGRMGQALLCHNPKYDADKLDYPKIRGELNDELQPYLVHGFLVYFVEGAMFAGGIGLLGALLRTSKKRRSLDEERTTLEAELRLLREKRARLTGSAGSYRGA